MKFKDIVENLDIQCSTSSADVQGIQSNHGMSRRTLFKKSRKYKEKKGDSKEDSGISDMGLTGLTASAEVLSKK